MAITILGFDPGLKTTGWGFIEKEGPILKYLASGEIKTSEVPGNFRDSLSAGVREILQYRAPDACAVEDFVAYPGKRVRRRVPAVQDILMGNTIGIITNTICTIGLRPNMAIAPAWEIKKAVTGQGKATKAQVRAMVRRLLNIEEWELRTGCEKKLSSHCADALAAAIWYAHSLDVNKVIEVMSEKGEGE